MRLPAPFGQHENIDAEIFKPPPKMFPRLFRYVVVVVFRAAIDDVSTAHPVDVRYLHPLRFNLSSAVVDPELSTSRPGEEEAKEEEEERYASSAVKFSAAESPKFASYDAEKEEKEEKERSSEESELDSEEDGETDKKVYFDCIVFTMASFNRIYK